MNARSLDPLPLDESDREFTAVMRHFAALCHVPRGELDDFVQDVWVRILPRLGAARAGHSPRQVATWLYRVVHNQAIDHVRRRVRRPVRRLSESVQGRLTARDAGPERALDRREIARNALAEMRKLLPEASFRILHMYYVEGRSISEIAKKLALTPVQVWSRKHRALKKVREHFRGGGGLP